MNRPPSPNLLIENKGLIAFDRTVTDRSNLLLHQLLGLLWLIAVGRFADR